MRRGKRPSYLVRQRRLAGRTQAVNAYKLASWQAFYLLDDMRDIQGSNDE